MKALTLTQPWATLVSIGAKRIETRSWNTSYRGALAIHAAKGFPMYAKEMMLDDMFISPLARAGYTSIAALPTSAIVATCRLVDVKRVTSLLDAPDKPERCFGNYTIGRYMWYLEDVVKLDVPIHAKGALSLWEWTPEKE